MYSNIPNRNATNASVAFCYYGVCYFYVLLLSNKYLSLSLSFEFVNFEFGH